ncbi:MAG: acyl-phosphate glycerol 3-phosphate acyltransferase, partial [Gammaproteobacteria bacterium GWE2_37_16]
MFIAVFLVIFAYLMGSLSSAIIVSKLLGLPDPRTQGSGNPGATNILRLGGKFPAIITLISDILKGLIPVLIANLANIHGFWLGVIALAAVVGHVFPVFFNFKGGKGVATALGAFIALNIWIGIIAIAVWLIVTAIWRYVSLASLIATWIA